MTRDWQDYDKIFKRKKCTNMFSFFPTETALELWRRFVCKILADEFAEWVRRNDTFAKHLYSNF